MNKKEYTKPQVRKYSVAGATAMFAVSPEKSQVKVNGKSEFVNGGVDTEGKKPNPVITMVGTGKIEKRPCFP